MATITLLTGGIREIPDDTRSFGDHGVQWKQEDEVHLIPWTAILEVTWEEPASAGPMVDFV